ncbi:MAG: LuxR C-terminal-related transcriptional regulator [Burkholderiales bacterium]
MKILLVDDHALFRAGLRLLLATIAPDVILFEAATVDEALALATAHQDMMLCLLDLELKLEQGLPVLKRIKAAAPDVAVVIVSASEDWSTVRICLEAGAMSYIPKSATSEMFLHALLGVLAGEVFLPPGFNYIDEFSPPAVSILTPRQHEVLEALSRGLPTKQIARELSLSEYTIKEHIANIFRILGVHNRVEAIIKANRLLVRGA